MRPLGDLREVLPARASAGRTAASAWSQYRAVYVQSDRRDAWGESHAAYAMAEALGWQHGLNEGPRRAKLFYESVLGEHVNGPLSNAIGWVTTAVMFAAAIALVWT